METVPPGQVLIVMGPPFMVLGEEGNLRPGQVKEQFSWPVFVDGASDPCPLFSPGIAGKDSYSICRRNKSTRAAFCSCRLRDGKRQVWDTFSCRVKPS